MTAILGPQGQRGGFIDLKAELNVTELLEANEGQGNATNAQFLIDQIKDAKDKLDKGKLSELPQEVQNSAANDMVKSDMEFAKNM